MPKAIAGSVFAGAFAYGVRAAGFDVPIHLEHGDYGTRTAQLNFPDVEIRVGVDNWKPETIKKVDFMFTNPPCAPWSPASHGRPQHWSDDPRLQCVVDLVDAGLAIRPKAWCWESVIACWSKGRSFVESQARRWMDAGYHATLLLTDSRWMGAPASRKRQFFIAHQHWLICPPFSNEPPTIGQILHKVKMTKKDVPPLICDVCWERSLWDEAVKHGGSYSAAYQHLSPEVQATIRCKPSFLTCRLRENSICGVLFPGNAWHPYEHRRLAYKEILALQGLPFDWKVETDNFGDIGGLMQRGVLPAVGTWIGTAVLNGLSKRKLTASPVFRVIDIRRPDRIIEEIII